MSFFVAHTHVPLKIILAVNVSVSYQVKSLNSQQGRVSAVESKKMKSTLLIIYNKGFCLRKTFLTAGGYRSEVNHVPLSYW